ncbi:fructosamine kinase family protein [Imhoffiella purpurea]|uniref:Ribulosamine/erythrulosamine 3-kinase potentially involved in protein deglycation n=1 Tax=Imhoffiella purpurea TaxID=1249627 RepID=W9V928_9GAMM|nr:fructosamine kinase family protein [Imhoffiella purpurea]EXJ13346.1 Ribulosamine/erythrulosamine 3-kinase potentially involved in protein deglycation [Imhoffiella purpurea]
MTSWAGIAERIGEATGEPFAIERERSVGGGCINRAAVIDDGRRSYFVKLNAADRAEMFAAESEGLSAMAEAEAIRVPQPICTGVADGQSFLVMELIDLGGRLNGALAGEQLAAMHRSSSGTFGWHRDNTIGSTPQSNRRDADWIAFWREQRLGYQLRLAADNGYGGTLQRSGERLLADLDVLLGHDPIPSLLHGDLWGGNIGSTPDGQPVIFDPAAYYGDREADLAMTELFGGFGADFYAAYRSAWPLDPGYPVRKTLYNLYHVLNHLNLFGGGYLGQSSQMIARLLAEIR